MTETRGKEIETDTGIETETETKKEVRRKYEDVVEAQSGPFVFVIRQQTFEGVRACAFACVTTRQNSNFKTLFVVQAL